jgi:hypothetical protein
VDACVVLIGNGLCNRSELLWLIQAFRVFYQPSEVLHLVRLLCVIGGIRFLVVDGNDQMGKHEVSG